MRQRKGKVDKCLYVHLCEYMHGIYAHIYVQQTNSAGGITKYPPPLKARIILFLGELLKRQCFEELGIAVTYIPENTISIEVGVVCNVVVVFI